MGNCLVKRKLETLGVDDVSDFSFGGKTYMIKVVSVYDGDTITAIMKYNKGFYKFKIRMTGYDCPEMKPPLANPDRQYEIRAAEEAREALKKLILGKVVKASCQGSDKYGRLLMTVFANDRNVNHLMVAHGYGYEYSGKTKKVFDKNTWNPIPIDV